MNKFWNCGWKQMKPKTKKERFHHDYSDKFFTCICLVFYLLYFYFLIVHDWRAKGTYSDHTQCFAWSLQLLFFCINPFLTRKRFWHLCPHYEKVNTKLNLHSINGSKLNWFKTSLRLTEENKWNKPRLTKKNYCYPLIYRVLAVILGRCYITNWKKHKALSLSHSAKSIPNMAGLWSWILAKLVVLYKNSFVLNHFKEWILDC